LVVVLLLGVCLQEAQSSRMVAFRRDATTFCRKIMGISHSVSHNCTYTSEGASCTWTCERDYVPVPASGWVLCQGGYQPNDPKCEENKTSVWGSLSKAAGNFWGSTKALGSATLAVGKVEASNAATKVTTKVNALEKEARKQATIMADKGAELLDSAAVKATATAVVLERMTSDARQSISRSASEAAVALNARASDWQTRANAYSESLAVSATDLLRRASAKELEIARRLANETSDEVVQQQILAVRATMATSLSDLSTAMQSQTNTLLAPICASHPSVLACQNATDTDTDAAGSTGVGDVSADE